MAAAAPGLRPPPSCGLRQARARATGRRLGLERPARAPMASDVHAYPAPGWRARNGLCFASRRRKTTGTRPPQSEVSGGEEGCRKPRVGVRGTLRQHQHRNLG